MLIAAAVPAFMGSLVEFVEAFTIILAIGVTRGWRAPILGAGAALEALRAEGRRPEAFDWIGFVASYKAMLLEGLEVAFIVIALGAAGASALGAATLGAAAAFVVVAAVGAVVRHPLSRVPENTLKYFVGAMLCTFGVFWAAEGMGIAWPGDVLALPVIFGGFVLVSLAGVRILESLVPGGRVVSRAV